jgi:hypothetical protein
MRTYFRIGRRLGHVVIASVPQAIEAQRFLYLVGTAKPHWSRRVTVLGTTTVRGHAAQYVHPSLDPRLDPQPRNGGAIFMGYIVLIWTEGRHTYAVGVVGGEPDARSTEAAIARQLVLVGPGRSARL